MTTGTKLGYVSLWVKQDLDDSSSIIASGKLNLVDKSIVPFNLTVFKDKDTGKSSLKVSCKGEDGKWNNYGSLEIEQKQKGKMIAYAKGRFDGQDVVVFLYDNSEKQELNSKAPDYTGTLYVDEDDKKPQQESSRKSNVVF